MNRILSTTAMAAMLMGAPALAQQEGSDTPSGGASGSGDIFAQVPSNPELQLGSDMMGSAVYSTMAAAQQSAEGSSDGSTSESGSSESGSAEGSSGGETDRQRIGEINDVIITQDGQVEYVVIGVGGFLGIGERSVAVNMDAIEFTQDPEAQGEFMMTVPATQQDIENAPEFDPATLRAGGGSESGSGGEQSGMGEDQSGAEQAAEEAGQEAQQAGQAAQDAAQSGGQQAQDAAQQAEQAAQDAAQQAEQAAEGAAQEAGEAAESAGQAAEDATSNN